MNKKDSNNIEYNTNEESINGNNRDILDDKFFDAFSPSKNIAGKKQKINELIANLKNNKIYLSSLLSIKNRQKLSKLYELILSNLTENNNSFVLNQLELIDVLGQYLYDQTEFKSFYKQALPKLFDKLYLQNQKINETIIRMFNNSISNRILNIEDYYPHLENMALEEDDDYKIIVLKFFYNQMINNENINYENIPKNVIDIIGNMQKEENMDIVKIASKIMNNIKAHLNQNDDDNNDINKDDDNKKEINDEPNYDNKDNRINNKLNENALHDIDINTPDYMNDNNNVVEKNDGNIFNNNENDNNNFNNQDNLINMNNNMNDGKINEMMNNNENINNPKILNENNEEMNNNNQNKNFNNIDNTTNDNEGNAIEEKIQNDKKRNSSIKDGEDIPGEISRVKSNKRKSNHKSRINRPRKLGVIAKNKKDNEEKDKGKEKEKEKEVEKEKEKEIEKKNENNENKDIMNTPEKKPNKKDGILKKGKSNKKSVENNENINNFDEMPIKPMNNNSDNNLVLTNETEKKNNIVNIDDLPIKGGPKYDLNFMDNENEPKIQEKKSNVVNIDDMPIKGVNFNLNTENEPELKKESIFNMDDLPIAGLDNPENEINDILDLNKSMKIEMDKNFFNDDDLDGNNNKKIIIKKVW